MNQILLLISHLAMLAFLLTSMLVAGLSLTLGQIIAPLRNARLVVAALFVNFAVVPLVAVGIAKLFRLDEPFAIGLLLLGLAPGAPFLPKLVEFAKGDLAFAVGLMVLLMVGTIVYLPVVLPRLLPGVKVGMWPIARPLVLLMFIPLVVGLAVKARWASFAARLQTGLNRVSNMSLVLVIVLVVALNLSSVVNALGSGAAAAATLLMVLAGLAGYCVGGTDMATRKVMVLGTGYRNIAAALVVGKEDFRDPQVIVLLVITVLVGLILLLPVTLVWGKRRAVAPVLEN